jgi:hypothetical protein
MDECVHGLMDATCALCKAGEGSVWVSAGGRAFHSRRDCELLTKGQRAVVRWGGDPSDVEQMARATAVRMNRQPCHLYVLAVARAHGKRARR